MFIIMIVHVLSQTSEEQDLVYAIPNIARRKPERNDDTEKEETIYSEAREYSGGADSS